MLIGSCDGIGGKRLGNPMMMEDKQASEEATPVEATAVEEAAVVTEEVVAEVAPSEPETAETTPVVEAEAPAPVETAEVVAEAPVEEAPVAEAEAPVVVETPAVEAVAVEAEVVAEPAKVDASGKTADELLFEQAMADLGGMTRKLDHDSRKVSGLRRKLSRLRMTGFLLTLGRRQKGLFRLRSWRMSDLRRQLVTFSRATHSKLSF
ncbi:hypothetical protein CCB80_01470 [Armatimonadetes bacterium Uphvl-Ar1]|nr:hypothetical protein CCB80_01470 [Armatimonadetes bacterium Uphvl-Ar1]